MKLFRKKSEKDSGFAVQSSVRENFSQSFLDSGIDFCEKELYDKLRFTVPVIDASIPEKRPGHALADAAHESTLLSEKYERVAKEKGIYFLDASRYVKPSPADCLHMEPEEHAKLGKAVAEKIRGIFEATNAVNKDML